MSEMLATSSAKSIEEIRSFISRQQDTYRTPYEAQPKDPLRQCVFGGSSNPLDFLPLDLSLIHISAKETMEDKIKRMLREEVRKM